MSSTAQGSYLETEILTAAPQKLRLILIDAAIGAIQRTREHWRRGETEEACESLVHAQQVVTELIASLNRDADSDLMRKIAGVYLFVFRSLLEASADQDETKLDDALKVLTEERESWRQVCEQYGASAQSEKARNQAVAMAPPSALPSETTPPPDSNLGFSSINTTEGGFSLEV